MLIKEKISNVVFVLINLLTVILLFTLVDYFVHELEDLWSVPPHYFWNKVPAALLLAVIGTLLTIKVRGAWLRALLVGLFTATLLQGKYFIEDYPLDFVLLFLLLHFLMLYPLLVLMFWVYNKSHQPKITL